MAAHKYGIAGNYTVQVTVSSPTFLSPLRAELPFHLCVVEPIRDVYLQPVLGRYASAFKRQRNGTQATDVIVFEARTDQGSHVTFVFDFGDGNRAVVFGEIDTFMNVPNGRASHVYVRGKKSFRI